MKKNTSMLIALATLVAASLLPLALRAEDKAPAKDDYPLEKCLVSDEKLGDMGEPYVMQYEGQTVKFCCKDCLKKFKKDPEKYLKILADARKEKEAQKAAAPAPQPPAK